MKKILILFSFIVCLSCTYTSKKKPTPKNISTSYTGSHDLKYLKLLDDLKNDYVLYYRTNKAIGSDLSTLQTSGTDSKFILDSIKYWKSHQEFFRQSRDFIEWLLSFKYDSTKCGLWAMTPNPISSHISECNLNLSNSRAAIILAENFLVGDGFNCYECQLDNRQKCTYEKYREVEDFLQANSDKDIDKLRLAWKEKNDR
jgi:hypothetical protein